ncbi:hypothetical protein DSLASN_10870 [Desulfoluna limicola]|uniref:DUF304 domain-containing protein n=1 Tax=Desulfoluna limicola TaxID=2810562 RepID=A0ABM7PE57_9BACT|nr:hypothetical protein [Desulfoluna limicola]BCS95455.1 hypothetical protein DSLASN_10870 [Desulfoluna limicola]
MKNNETISLGELREEFIASDAGWIVMLVLSFIMFGFSGTISFIIVETVQYGGWPIPLAAMCCAFYLMIKSLYFRRGATLRVYENGFEYISGRRKRIVADKSFNIIRAVILQGQLPAIDIGHEGKTFTVQSKWFHRGDKILPMLASMASFDKTEPKSMPKSTIFLAVMMAMVFFCVVIGVVFGFIQ